MNPVFIIHFRKNLFGIFISIFLLSIALLLPNPRFVVAADPVSYFVFQ